MTKTVTCSECGGSFDTHPYDHNKAGGMCDLHPGICLTCCISFGRGPISAAKHFEIWNARKAEKMEVTE